jgi:hypothetical protein
MPRPSSRTRTASHGVPFGCCVCTVACTRTGSPSLKRHALVIVFCTTCAMRLRSPSTSGGSGSSSGRRSQPMLEPRAARRHACSTSPITAAGLKTSRCSDSCPASTWGAVSTLPTIPLMRPHCAHATDTTLVNRFTQAAQANGRRAPLRRCMTPGKLRPAPTKRRRSSRPRPARAAARVPASPARRCTHGVPASRTRRARHCSTRAHHA